MVFDLAVWFTDERDNILSRSWACYSRPDQPLEGLHAPPSLNASSQQKDANVTWSKGESGNRKGRPRRSIAAAVRRMIDPDEVVKFLASTVDSEHVPIGQRLQAAQMILDRGWGKPLQRNETSLNVSQAPLPAGWAEMAPAARQAFLLETRRRALTGAIDVDGEESDD